MDDMDYYEWEASKRRFTFPKILKFILKFIAAVIIIGTFALILGRGQLMKIPKNFSGITWTDSIVSAYNSGEIDIVYQQPYESFDKKGLYHISDVILSKSTNEVQLTVRYNSRNTINTLMEKYSISERPSGEAFIYILKDENGNTYTDYTFASESKPLYEFRRVIFSGVELADVETLYLDIYYIEHVSDKSPMHTSFIAYDGKLDVAYHAPYEQLDIDDWYRLSGFNFSKKQETAGFTLRYNSKNVNEKIINKYGVSELPEELFYYTLVDGNGNEYTDYTVTPKSESEYEFRELSFTGVELNNTAKLFLNVFCVPEITSDPKPIAGFEMRIGELYSEFPTYKKAGSTTLVFNTAPTYVSELEDKE